MLRSKGCLYVCMYVQYNTYMHVYVLYGTTTHNGRANYSSERFDLARCWIQMKEISPRRYSASTLLKAKRTNTTSASHEYALAWYPTRRVCFIGPKAANNVRHAYSGVLKSLNYVNSQLHSCRHCRSLILYICLQQRGVYIPPPKTQFDGSHFLYTNHRNNKTFN